MSKILVIEDDPAAAFLLKEFIDMESVSAEFAESGYDGLEAIKRDAPDLVLLDLNLPDLNGMDVIGEIQKIISHCEIIVVTGQESAESALQAINLGARDYIVKPIKRERLQVSIQNALDRIELAQQLKQLKETDNQLSNFNGLVGQSAVILDLFKTIENIAASDETTFITGEQGTGKTLCANIIHNISARKDKPFIRFNCLSANKNNVLEKLSEALQHSEGGTLYIHNVTALDLETQTALFSLFENDVKARLICSSPVPPLEAVEAGDFREDLYYRLNILPLNIPPLRQRGRDIGLLSNYFLKTFSDKHNKNFAEFDDLTLKTFTSHHWPGNIRELKNIIRSVTTLAPDGPVIKASMLPKSLLHISHDAEQDEQNGHENAAGNMTMFKGDKITSIRDLERMAIKHALDVCKGNVQEAALHLKISPATLYRKKPDA